MLPPSNQYIISHESSTGFSIQPNGNTTSGNLDVGSGNSSKINVHAANNGYTGYAEVHCSSPWELTLNVETNFPNGGYMIFKTKGVMFMITRGDHQTINYYKPLVNSSDDRLKENEEVIENACETLSKLRPQLYDKKPNMENNDPTTWFKESGLIAQEIYYDAPELRHLSHRGIPELDEEGNSIPLPEIPTSIDPTRP